jgi:putative mRNA 3-end processing factor
MNLIELQGDGLVVAGLAVNQPHGGLPCVVTHPSRLAHVPSGSLVPDSFAALLPAGHAMRLVPVGQRVKLPGLDLCFEPAGGRCVSLHLDVGGVAIGIQTGALAERTARRDLLVLDASYALPIYCWPTREQLALELRTWLASALASHRPALLLGDPADELRTALELLAVVPLEPIFVAPSVGTIVANASISLRPLPAREARKAAQGALILAPLTELETPTLPALGPVSLGIASGRMRIRGARRRLAADQGFELSSRADWPTLLRAAAESGAREVLTFGRHATALAQTLTEHGLSARSLEAGAT